MPIQLSPSAELLVRIVTRDGAVHVGHMLEGPPDLAIVRPLPVRGGVQAAVRAIPVASIAAVATREARGGRHRLLQLAGAVAGVVALHLLAFRTLAPLRPLPLVLGAMVGAVAASMALFNLRRHDAWYAWADQPVAEFFEDEASPDEVRR